MRLVGVVAGCLVLCWSGNVHAEGLQPPRIFEFLPERLDYQPYVADPRRPRFGSSVLIGDTGEVHIDNAIGGTFPLLDLELGVPPIEKLQLAGFAGVWSRFDIRENLDQVGTDFRVGLSLSMERGPWAVRLQDSHESDHLGDELITRTGRSRLGYRREEIALGVSYTPQEDLRLYAEGGYGYALGGPNEPWRAQAGIEWEGGPRLPLGARLFAASDLQTYQEVDWEVDWTLQAGLVKWNQQRNRSLRLFAEYHIGHDPLGEFFRETLSYGSLGFAFDF